MIASPLLPHLTGSWGGTSRPASDARTFDVVDPATGAVLARLPEYGAAAATQAVDAAVAALDAEPDAPTRRRWLLGHAEQLVAERDELARIITAENGKPLAEARGEVEYAAGFYREAARQLDRLEVFEPPERPRSLRWQIHHRRAGVAALITPWNFPVAMLAKKLAGALAAGCPAVVKPSELTPLSAIAVFTLLERLDLPPGMVNLVFGRAAEIGAVLCARPEVRVLSFTGSTGVGRLLAAQCAPTLKRLSLELGGNAPFVVFEDADLDRAADALMANKFRCAGQTCVCSNRVLVHQDVHDAFVARVAERVGALQVGPGDRPGVQIGPLIDRRGWAKVRDHVADAVAGGARVVVGGGPALAAVAVHGGQAEGASCFYPPTVLVDVRAGMRCQVEETFGPIVAVRRFADEAEAIRLANDTEYGLAAYLFSGDPARLQGVAARLHFGHVGLNTAAGPTPELPFGGMEQSGLGREGGLEGLLEFIELQTCPIGDE